ncbi:hypothetical protein FJT64_021148 [Amphibalanus amphitrite]|uniref:Uncharacterized protein n=1 Tax=Amphibalanus amphitrite TaxID=1232801 RepID=A0A6A4WJG5_AMPAM|nr:hypothetical protein FJT64_021148 [Amphibalanus amphitrite]
MELKSKLRALHAVADLSGDGDDTLTVQPENHSTTTDDIEINSTVADIGDDYDIDDVIVPDSEGTTPLVVPNCGGSDGDTGGPLRLSDRRLRPTAVPDRRLDKTSQKAAPASPSRSAKGRASRGIKRPKRYDDFQCVDDAPRGTSPVPDAGSSDMTELANKPPAALKSIIGILRSENAELRSRLEAEQGRLGRLVDDVERLVGLTVGSSGVFDDSWRVDDVTDTRFVYRLVTLTSSVAKLAERMVVARLTHLCNLHRLIPTEQMMIESQRTQIMVLSQWSRDVKDAAIKVSSVPVRVTPTAKLLGDMLDWLLHVGEHCANLERKARPRTAQLRKLIGHSWGLIEHHLRALANSYARGAIEHAAAAWLPAAQTLRPPWVGVATPPVDFIVAALLPLRTSREEVSISCDTDRPPGRDRALGQDPRRRPLLQHQSWWHYEPPWRR